MLRRRHLEYWRFRDDAALSISRPLCEFVEVKHSIHLCRLLAILLIVGLVVAPFSARANAGMTSMDMAAMDMTSTKTVSMSADMPCCPDRSAPADCDGCPLMAICMVKTFQTPSAAAVAEILAVTTRMLLPASDPQAESLGYLPPPRPPRSLVRSA